jgi:hypothetical protein
MVFIIWFPADSITKYRLLELFNHYLRVTTPLIIHPSSGHAPTSRCWLRTKFDFGCQIPDYETMVQGVGRMDEGAQKHVSAVFAAAGAVFRLSCVRRRL